MTNQIYKSLLIFDLDGTLIDSVPDLADAVNIMLSKLSKNTYPAETIRHWVGNGSRTLVERALVGKVNTDDAALDKDYVTHAETLFFAAYEKTSGHKTVAYSGVEAGLKRLASVGYTLALVTNKPARFLPSIMAHFNWQTLFALTIGGDSLASKKPHPLPLQYVCQTLDFLPQQAYMIGDSKNDILAGHNAGIDTLGLSYGYNYGLDIRDFAPSAAFDSFDELTDYLCAQVE